jgi:hypothetical protein
MEDEIIELVGEILLLGGILLLAIVIIFLFETLK